MQQGGSTSRKTTLRIGLICISIFAEPVYGQPDASAQGQAALDRAKQWQRAGDYVSAIAEADKGLSLLDGATDASPAVVGSAAYLAASLHHRRGEFQRAEYLYKRSLEIREAAFGPDHEDVAESLTGLADLYRDRVPYLRVEPLYQRALDIRRKRFGSEHPLVASSLDRLASFLASRGETVRVEAMYAEALNISELTLGEKHPDVARILTNLGRFQRASGRLDSAKALHSRAMSLWESAPGPAQPDAAGTLSELAEDYYAEGNFGRASALFQQALSMRERTLGPTHPDVAASVRNLARVFRLQGDNLRAETLYARSLQIALKSLGENHPLVADLFEDLAGLYRNMNLSRKVIDLQAQALEIEERNLNLIISAGFEEQKLAYLRKLSPATDIALSLPLASNGRDSRAVRVALTTLLRRKGRVVETASDSSAALRRSGADADGLLDKLASARGRLAMAVLQPESVGTSEVVKLDAEARQLESEVSSRSAYFRLYQEPVTIERVQRAIPADAVLVEFASYWPFEKIENLTLSRWRFGARRYAAFVLRRNGAPTWLDLGGGKSLDGVIARLREAIRNPKSDEFRKWAGELDRAVIRPVRRVIGKTRWILLAPDGDLNLVPFAALVDQKGRYLIENFTLTYVTTGRDLIRTGPSDPPREPPRLFADPLFDLGGTSIQASDGLSSFASTEYAPLPATAEEAAQIAVLLDKAQVFTGRDATEAAVKRVKGPEILHISTHGFFLSDQDRQPLDSRALGLDEGAVRFSDPMLRSGLVLAGVRQGHSGEGEDGVLTALEAASLDLVGTKLVVLSACDTGIGDISNGEGVFGLRRAMMIAGAQTQILSLWPVSDRSTARLMVTYYQMLLKGAGRSEGLRQAQLLFVGDNKFKHPYYWAPFIQSGDWSPLRN